MSATPTVQRASYAQITDFLTHKRIAAIGVSRNPQDFTRRLVAELRHKGFEVFPVNPAVKVMDGQPCFARISDIHPPVDTALVLTSPAASEQVVRDCAAAGIAHIWLYGTGNLQKINPAAVDFCRARGIDVIPGECPYMFIGSFPHRIHGFINKLVGIYPG